MDRKSGEDLGEGRGTFHASNAQERQRRALQLAVAVAREHGIISTEPYILKDWNNTIVHLAPFPVVAKVATGHRGTAVLPRELSVATHLAQANAPVVPPSSVLPPGPHTRGESVLTLWEFCEHDPEQEAEGFAAGEALSALHAALADYGGELPPFTAVIDEVRRLLMDGQALTALAPSDRAFLRDLHGRLVTNLSGFAIVHSPLHGESHMRNLLVAAAGPRWIDFEAACRGPQEWDLAALPDEATVAFPHLDQDLLALLRTLRSLCVAVYCWLQPDRAPEVREAATYHLHQLRLRAW
jgi:Ser/Thr protein kinase RdoA (MazF antagonist)